MDLRDLKLFLQLADSQHFGQTAKATHVTPSTLSRQIQRLEEELGQALFVRDNRTVKITDAGIQFKQFAQQTLANYQHLQYSLKQGSLTLSGELRLFCSVTAAYSHLPSILDRFRAKYPQVEIKLATGDAANALDKVLSNEADLAIAGRPELLPQRIEFYKIGEIPMVLIYPALSCQVNEQVAVPAPDWAKVPFILPEHGPSKRRIDFWFRQNRIVHPTIYATVAGHEAIVSMVALGCGVALIPEVVLENSPDAVKDRIAKLNYDIENPTFDIGVCVQKKRLNEPLISAFWSLLQ